MKKTLKLVLAGQLIALGVVMPYMFHLFRLGSNLLPMHFPVLIAGLLLGPGYGLSVGAVAPVMSSFMTGMPPFPNFIGMAFELGSYGCCAGYFYFSRKFNIWLSVMASILVSRLVLAIVYSLFFPLVGLKEISFWQFLTLSLLPSLPGMVAQFALVPVFLIIKNHIFKGGVYEQKIF